VLAHSSTAVGAAWGVGGGFLSFSAFSHTSRARVCLTATLILFRFDNPIQCGNDSREIKMLTLHRIHAHRKPVPTPALTLFEERRHCLRKRVQSKPANDRPSEALAELGTRSAHDNKANIQSFAAVIAALDELGLSARNHNTLVKGLAMGVDAYVGSLIEFVSTLVCELSFV
jgi:hypothetical protein